MKRWSFKPVKERGPDLLASQDSHQAFVRGKPDAVKVNITLPIELKAQNRQ
jgi:hypothetical protein